MSRLTASPFHKPSPYEFPSAVHPLSPPDTDSEMGVPMEFNVIPGSNSVFVGAEFDNATNKPLQAETPAARFKRVSTLSYHSSGLRGPGERISQKASKSLVIVIPPDSLVQEHGQLGHNSLSSPQKRLAHGVLLPLLPTLYAQLTAIAREFNFPSTAGLCLYLSISEDGITLTPRITDDTWQILWGHILDGATSGSPGSSGLPIAGRIEFDIDPRKARWYAAWITAALREQVEHDVRSMSHWRGDSKTSFADDQAADEPERPLFMPNQGLLTRHIPKKLSLVDRFELSSSRSASRSGTLPPALTEAQTVPILSPIVQAEEPHTAKQDLEKRVKSWRASASLVPTPMPEVAGFVLEERKNALASDPQEEEEELNLDDFMWSVTSAGPPSYGTDTSSLYRLPSIHMDRRMEESVCLTPSACTSFGPFDYDLHSPITEMFLVRTPDIGQRMVEDCPPTPSTATTWGAPLSWPATPFSEARPRSIHLGDRGQFSLPVTPSTATTWGALLTFPPTPITPFYVHTPDVGQRAFDVDDVDPICHVSQSPEAAHISTYPYLNIYPSAYPYLDLYPSAAAAQLEMTSRSLVDVKLQAVYPVFTIYPALYPHFDIYPHVPLTIGSNTAAQETQLALIQRCMPAALISAYPALNIYPDVYPAFNIYPDISGFHRYSSQEHTHASMSQMYGYPYFDIYPAVEELDVAPVQKSMPVFLNAQYPSFNIYRAVYPFFDLYPSVSKINLPESHCASRTSPSGRLHAYPNLCIYPVVYPHFDLYPSIATLLSQISVETVSPVALKTTFNFVYPFFDLYPALQIQIEGGAAISTKIDVVYPVFNLYPPVYPYFHLYNSCFGQLENRTSQLSNQLPARYPAISLYAAVYPHFEIYPACRPLVDHVTGMHDGIRVTTPTILKPARKHKQLHDEMFPNGDVYSPSGTPKVDAIQATKPPRIELPSVSPSMRTIRSRSGTVSQRPKAPAIVTVLPTPPPASDDQRSSPSRTSLSSPAALKRSPSAVNGLPSHPATMRPSPARLLSSKPLFVDARSRPLSVIFPSKPLVESSVPLDRAQSLSSRSPMRRRDSLVLQRARAYDSQTNTHESPLHHLDMHTLSQFPMPPVPPMPPLSATSPTRHTSFSQYTS